MKGFQLNSDGQCSWPECSFTQSGKTVQWCISLHCYASSLVLCSCPKMQMTKDIEEVARHGKKWGTELAKENENDKQALNLWKQCSSFMLRSCRSDGWWSWKRFSQVQDCWVFTSSDSSRWLCDYRTGGVKMLCIDNLIPYSWNYSFNSLNDKLWLMWGIHVCLAFSIQYCCTMSVI